MQAKPLSNQQEIGFGPASIAPINDVPLHLVAACRGVVDAVNLCMNQSRVRRSRTTWSALLGMHPGSLSLILNRPAPGTKAYAEELRRRYLDPDLFETIQRAAGNRAINQFFDLQIRGELNHQSTTRRKAALLAELQALEETE